MSALLGANRVFVEKIPSIKQPVYESILSNISHSHTSQLPIGGRDNARPTLIRSKSCQQPVQSKQTTHFYKGKPSSFTLCSSLKASQLCCGDTAVNAGVIRLAAVSPFLSTNEDSVFIIRSPIRPKSLQTGTPQDGCVRFQTWNPSRPAAFQSYFSFCPRQISG